METSEPYDEYQYYCTTCLGVILHEHKVCPHCGTDTSEFVAEKDLYLDFDPDFIKATERKRMLGVLGSIVLFIGVFTPIVSVPIVGNVNYFQNGKGDGVIILVLALISLILTLTNKFRALWLTGIGSLGVMIFTFINFQLKMSEAKAQMESQLSGNPFRGFADLAIQSIQIQWGWAVMIVGAGLVIAAAAVPLTPAHEG
jgi:hypothetical protein